MPEPFKVLIVDDEAPARAKVARFLAEDPRFMLSGEAEDGAEALAKAQALAPDLIFLDIQMPAMTGFEVLESLDLPETQVVFATAYDSYALQAFEASAVDFLLKPFDARRFRKALERAWMLLNARCGDASLKALLSGLAKRPLERLIVKAADRWIPVPLRSVRRLGADGRQVKVHTDQGEFCVRIRLQDLEARLDPRRFVRVHRSEIVALDAIDHLEPWEHGDGLLVLKGGGKVVLSRTYRKRFLERWGMEG